MFRSILREGRNCWKKVSARRVAFLVDADAYFPMFAEAAKLAKECIMVIGWDVDSRTSLNHHDPAYPDKFGEFMNVLLDRRPGMQVYVLDWDFSIIFAFERETFPKYKLDVKTHRNFHFSLDSKHPLGVSQHQKIIVIDDAVAFSGGLDLTIRRWDTPEHRPDDRRRVDPAGNPYLPFHDVQIAVDGKAASLLGDLARTRWYNATGERLKPPSVRSDPWPEYFKPDAFKGTIGIARTASAYAGRDEIREIENLYLDSIAAAQHSIYMESQFFTSASVSRALAARLNEKKGPEVVIVVPRESSGWLEEKTMGILRSHAVSQLRKADRFNRFRIYYPVVSGGIPVNLHSKIMIADNRLARVGSANLTNRSMCIDTECDIILDAEGDKDVETAICDLRNRLIGEHTGIPADETARVFSGNRSVINTIEMLHDKGRMLVPLEILESQEWIEFVPIDSLADPEQPIDPERLLKDFIVKNTGEKAGTHFVRWAVILFFFLLIAVLWRWTPLGTLADVRVITEHVVRFRSNPLAPLVIIGSYAIGSMIMFPINILSIATILAFSPFSGFFYALMGTLSSASVGYFAGRLGHEPVRRYAGSWFDRLTRRLAKKGVLPVIVVRILPLAPFGVINLVSGALHIRFRDYFIGTLIGNLPGLTAMVVLKEGVRNAIQDRGLINFVILLAIMAVLLVGFGWIRKYARSKRISEKEDPGNVTREQ